MAVSAVYTMACTVTETIGNNTVGLSTTAAQKQVVYSALDRTGTINAGTAVPATTVVAFNQAMSGGAATVDLSAVPGTNGATTSLSGLKVQIIKIIAKSTNANNVTVETGASNGYNLGAGAFSVTLAPGQEIMLFGNEACPDVGSSAKTLDISGTLTQSVDFVIVAG